MLTSYQPSSLDANSFSNPVVFVSCPLSPCPTTPTVPPSVVGDSTNTTTDHQHLACCPLQHQHCPWTRGCSSAPVVQPDQLSAGHFFWWPDTARGVPAHPASKALSVPPCCEAVQREEEVAMEVVQPEEDLMRLVDNDLKLRLSGFYYGSLGWVEASEMLKRCEVGTFLVRDSEHASYLYSLSVQTTRGPTSCRVDYHDGRFRLDASEDLARRMPRFETTTDLIEHYVQLTTATDRRTTTKSHHRQHQQSPVWLDLAGNPPSDKQEVPVQMYRPLYRSVRSLQHLCRVKANKVLREGRPLQPLDRTIEGCQDLPKVLRDYLKEYPHSQ